MSSKVRLVRCPRCRRVLPELAEIPLYKCGGCGAVLQAKKRKSESNAAESCEGEEAPTNENKLEHASKDEDTILQQKSSNLPSEEPGKDVTKFDNVYTDFAGESSGLMNCSDEPRTSIEISCHGTSESSPEARDHIRLLGDKSPFDEYDGRDQKVGADSDKPSSDDIFSSPELNRFEIESPELNHFDIETPLDRFEVEEREPLLEEETVKDTEEFKGITTVLPANLDRVKEASSSAELNHHEVEEPSCLVTSDSETCETMESSSMIIGTDAEKLLDTIPRKSEIPSEDQLDKDLVSDNMMSLEKEFMEKPPNVELQGLEHISSANTLENLSFRKPISDTLKSPTRKSYYSYDGSVSSFDGNDDRLTNLGSLPSIQENILNSKEFGRREENRTRRPLYSRHMLAAHGGPSSSNSVLKDSQYGMGYPSASNSINPESKKMELMRMVCELEDQLDRATFMKGGTNLVIHHGAANKEKLVSAYHDSVPATREIYHDLNHRMYSRSYDQEKSWSHQYNSSGMAFPENPSNNRSCNCYSCCQDHPPQHPQRVISSNEKHFESQPSYRYYSSYPSSSHRHSDSEIPSLSYKTKSDDAKNPHLLRKTRSPKQHWPAVASGAPMISCYRCSELLQLPADFLLFKRRHHSLKCGSCSKALKFSLQNQTHIVRYVSEGIAPPPSEVDDYADSARKGSLGNSFRAAYVKYAKSSSSFSDGYSTETGRPFHAHRRETNLTEIPSGSSYQAEDRKKVALSGSQSQHENLVRSFDPNRFSSNWTNLATAESEIEEIPGSGSPLHRLMGYSSPSKVMRD